MLNATFFNKKFPEEILRSARLSFFTSQTLLENGGANFLEGKDFRTPIDEMSEGMALDFLI